MKTIQIKWTDIEIRKYRLNDAAAGNIPKENQYIQDEVDELIPPLE